MKTSEPEDDLRDVLQPNPTSAPAGIDAAIRAHARQSLNSNTSPENQTAMRAPGKLLRLLPIAAVVVLSIGLIPRLLQEPVGRISAPVADTLQSADAVTTESLTELSSAREELMSADAAVDTESSIEASEQADDETLSFSAEAAPVLTTEIPEQSPAPRLRKSLSPAKNNDVFTSEREQATDILTLLRAGSDDKAQTAYRLWRTAWPDAEAVPKLDGMRQAEIDWFNDAAERFEQSR